MPDFVLRVDGFGFIGGATPDTPDEADATDELIVEMRAVDTRLDNKEYAAATRDYTALIVEMEKAPSPTPPGSRWCTTLSVSPRIRPGTMRPR